MKVVEVIANKVKEPKIKIGLGKKQPDKVVLDQNVKSVISSKQEQAKEVQDLLEKDGIMLEVGVDQEDLDYVDGIEDGSFDDEVIEEQEVQGQGCHKGNQHGCKTGPSELATRKTQGTGSNFKPEELNDEELASHPRVRNLFN